MTCQTSRPTPAACTRTSTSSSAISGMSMSLSSRTSGEPYVSRTIAFMCSARLPRPACSSRSESLGGVLVDVLGCASFRFCFVDTVVTPSSCPGKGRGWLVGVADPDQEGEQVAILQPLAACGGGLANAGQIAIIRVGRLGSKCRWIESSYDKPHPYEQLPQAARY